MYTLNFSTNWNNKLDCKYFTTIRIYNPILHKTGNKFDINLRKKPKIKAEIIAVKKGYVKDLGGYDCYLDTGYSKRETISIMQKMYPKVNFQHQQVALILLKKLEPPKPVQKELFT